MKNIKELIDMLKEDERVTDIMLDRESIKRENEDDNGWAVFDFSDDVNVSFKFHSPLKEG